MKEILNQLGYKFTGTCNCDGYYTEKYKNGDYKVKWRVKKGTFKVLKFGMNVTGWQSCETLKHTLTIHTNVAV